MKMKVKQKCPFNTSVLQVVLRLALMVLGTVGLIFLNVWVAIGYLIYYVAFFFLAMPLKHCQYCYYKVKETTLDKWRESYLEKWVGQGKKVRVFMGIIWLLPIVSIIISFFLNFSIFTLISLIGCIVVLVGNVIYMKRKVCTTCAIKDECHSSFEN